MSKKQRETLEKHRKELEETLNETIVDTIRQSALPNTIAFVGVVVVSFVVNLLLLIAVTGG
jgi:hypothetical protein